MWCIRALLRQFYVAATVRQELQIKQAIPPSHRGLTPGQPVLALTLQHQVPSMVFTEYPATPGACHGVHRVPCSARCLPWCSQNTLQRQVPSMVFTEYPAAPGAFHGVHRVPCNARCLPGCSQRVPCNARCLPGCSQRVPCNTRRLAGCSRRVPSFKPTGPEILWSPTLEEDALPLDHRGGVTC